MVRRALALGLMPALAALIAVMPAQADATATADLIPGPPAGAWEAYADGTKAMTATDIYGSQAGAVKGFADAYQKAWNQGAQGLVDRLEHYTTVLWAAFRLGEAEGAEKKNRSHTSYTTVPGFGSGAFEYTIPGDTQGVQIDVFVFVQGDYMAVIYLAQTGAAPDHSVLMDQANRQLGLIPMPVGEYNAIGNGMMSAVAIGAGVLGGITVVVAVIVLIVVMRSRRPRPIFSPAAAAPPNLSPDRRYWWDGQSWQDAAAKVPPGAYISPDGQWWDGVAWRPSPPGAR